MLIGGSTERLIRTQYYPNNSINQDSHLEKVEFVVNWLVCIDSLSLSMEARVMDMKTPPVDSEESFLVQQLDQEGLRLAADGCVHWKTDNPRHPRNWPLARKVHDVAWIIFLDFFVYATSSD